MSIFVVVLNPEAPEPFEEKIKELYPLSYRYADNVFFLEDDNIPETIANRLGIKVEDESQRTATGAVFGSRWFVFGIYGKKPFGTGC